jgi:two-component system, NarL family, nitrate/nitrite response regulator NarL
LIRVAIVAETLDRAQRLASLLADDERLEIVEARAIRPGMRLAMADVMVVAGAMPDELPENGPPAVLLTAGASPQAPFGGTVRAWLADDALPGEIAAAIVAAAQDLTVLTRGQARRWLKSGEAAEDAPAWAQEALTARELQVLRMLADGLGNKQIAGRLGISEHTAKFHVAQILAKLRAGSRAEAVAIGMRRGLVPI